jgi:ribosomal protein S18 acetylase RimI-like enzyme
LVVSELASLQARNYKKNVLLRSTTIDTDSYNRDEKDLGSIEVGPLGPSDLKNAIGVLARGLRDNPNHVAAFGDHAALRVARLDGFFETVISIAGWEALVARDRKGTIVGVMAMAGPGECRLLSLHKIQALSDSLAHDPETAAPILQWLEAWRERDPGETHWHLGPFAVDAHLQGKGVGSELLRVFCAQMDAGRENAYLETDTEESVGFCERFGFEVVGEHTVLGATNWFMMRRPFGSAGDRGRNLDMTDFTARQRSRNMFASRHESSSRGRARLRLVMPNVLIVALAAVLVPPPAARAETAAGEPVVGYWTDTNVAVADGDGIQIGTFPDFERFSLNGSVIAGELLGKKPLVDRRVVAFDSSSGERLFRIPDAMTPVVAAGGKRIAFLATARREDSAQSVWMRMATGRIRKVIQFSPGPGRPGVRHGMKAAWVVDFALDKRGRTMAVTFGNENMRVFDVWTVDVRTKAVTRMTRRNHSHSPSLSPDGGKLAVRVESTETCSDPLLGQYFMGKIRVFSPATGERETLAQFSCDLVYGDPRWIDNDSLVTTRAVRDETETYGFDLDLVRIDVSTGEISELVTDGNPCCITVSGSLGKVAYSFSDRLGFGVYDVGAGTVLDFPKDNYVPHLAGENRFCC